jgi:hypothetical protein
MAQGGGLSAANYAIKINWLRLNEIEGCGF